MENVFVDVNTGMVTKVAMTEEEVVAHSAAAAAYENSIPYYEKRREAYPPITDYIDGVVKGDQAQIDKYIAECLAVKEKFPK